MLNVLNVEHDSDRARGLIIRHAPQQFVAQHVLDPEIDGERQRPIIAGRIAELRVEALLDPGNAVIVGIDETDDLGKKRALRIDAAVLRHEPQRRHAQFHDVLLLLRREIALDPIKGTA